MKQTDKNLANQAKNATLECLSKITSLKFSDPKSETKYAYADFVLKTRIRGEPLEIIVQVKSNGQPLNARNAINQIYRYKDIKKNFYGLIFAPYISEKSAQIIREEGMGYVDLCGNCFIKFDNVYIEREGRENNLLKKRALGGLYHPKAERVLRVLLSDPTRSWTVQGLSNAADTSIGLASNVKKLLLEREWLEVLEDGIKLKAPKALLKEWSTNYNYKKNNVQSYYSMDSIKDIEDKIKISCESGGIKYALTGFSAAARVAPMVNYNRVMVYVEEKFNEYIWASGLNSDKIDLNLKKVDSGPNVMLFYPYDEGVFLGSVKINGFNVVSPVQSYLDLAGYKGRGEEAAQAILERVLKYNDV